MRYTTITALSLIFAIYSPAQEKGPIQISDEKSDDGLIIYASNGDLIPYTIELSVTQKNLKADLEFPAKIVIQPTEEPVPIAILTKRDPTKGWSYGSQYTFYRGDYRAEHNDRYAYGLPFERGERFIMSQGYGGSFSHQDKKAIDFTMPEGTKVLSARDGLVVQVKEKSNRGCPDRSCMDLANLITVMHDDGSFAEYVHLKKNGSLVKVGERVKKGQAIGLSGATGFASGAHLHFEVFLPSRGGNETVATYFETRPGNSELLKEKTYYEAF